MHHLLDAIGFFLSRIPDPALIRLARMLTWTSFSMLRIRRKLTLANLNIAYPDISDSERKQLARAAYQNFVMTCIEFLRAKHVDMAKDVTFEGLEHIQAALAKGRGAYILCMHMGNWEAMGAAINRTICPARVVVKTVGSAAVDAWVNEVRKLNGFQVIRRKKRGDGTRAILKTLRDGEIVGFVMDQSRPGEPRLPFFGAPAKTNTSFAGIWRKWPAPIVPSYVFRTRLGQHVIRFRPELHPVNSGDEEKDILATSAMFNAALEEMINAKPEHYFWLHNRWK